MVRYLFESNPISRHYLDEVRERRRYIQSRYSVPEIEL